MKQTYDVVDKGTNSSVNKLRETKHSEFFLLKNQSRYPVYCVWCTSIWNFAKESSLFREILSLFRKKLSRNVNEGNLRSSHFTYSAKIYQRYCLYISKASKNNIELKCIPYLFKGTVSRDLPPPPIFSPKLTIQGPWFTCWSIF